MQMHIDLGNGRILEKRGVSNDYSWIIYCLGYKNIKIIKYKLNLDYNLNVNK